MSPRKLALAVLVLLALLWFFWPHARVDHLTSKSGPIVVLGDSLAAGFGSESQRGYVAVLQQRLGLELINRGVSGDTTAQGLARLDKDVLSLDPAMVVVELGGNDFLQKVPVEETFANLDKIVTQIQNKRAAVLLLGTQSGVFSDKAASLYKELASRHHTGYVPNILQGILTRADLKSDAIHPNDRGYEAMAGLIEPEMRWMLHKMHRL